MIRPEHGVIAEERLGCTALPEGGCTLLEASIRSGAEAGATVRMRVTPDGIDEVLGSLDGRGKMVAQSSRGEDLAEPIEDAERKMTMQLIGTRDGFGLCSRQQQRRFSEYFDK